MTETTTKYLSSLVFRMRPRVNDNVDASQVKVISAREAVKYEYEIRDAILQSLSKSFDPEKDIVDMFLESEEILQRANVEILRITPSVTVRDEELKGLTTIVSTAELTRDALSLVLSFVDESYADIWGEGFETEPIDTQDGHLFVSFWNPTIYIKPVPELDGYEWFPYSIQIEYQLDKSDE